MWLLFIFGFVNHPLQIRAENENNTCAAHEKWTVFQRRKYGNVDFNRGWDDYVHGFGNCDGDFWLGLEPLHQATKEGDMSLEINMMTKDTKEHWVANYSHFSIGPGSGNYILNVSGYVGTLPVDDLAWHNGRQFSTKAQIPSWSSLNCEGAWWCEGCGDSHLNGDFNKTGWGEFGGMMVPPDGCAVRR